MTSPLPLASPEYRLLETSGLSLNLWVQLNASLSHKRTTKSSRFAPFWLEVARKFEFSGDPQTVRQLPPYTCGEENHYEPKKNRIRIACGLVCVFSWCFECVCSGSRSLGAI